VSSYITHDAYEDTRRELIDLEIRRNTAKPKERIRLDTKVDDARNRLTTLRNENSAPVDAQSQFLSALTFGMLDARHVRAALVALFAVMVEMCATLASLRRSHIRLKNRYRVPISGSPRASSKSSRRSAYRRHRGVDAWGIAAEDGG
jgi:hypothetical protein